ncbi:hypothetical protein NEOLEDRAFT_1173152 [Neolentinus lepideus HHB14362 ss-1]|uniref:Small ribosomal subunit protein bS18m n=1 Tax=Neolentinus lepideus HHB14362 ss-1 TaxID=1314782 RepID=A0A165N7N7_9AGAM|nr:hypothetical protein NEOLEDRAFT_1173152 [Neolentinus lepideus HHB14362 ss-1]
MSAVLRKLVHQGSCRRLVATLPHRAYSTPSPTYKGQIEEVQQAFNDAASKPQPAFPYAGKDNGPFNLFSDNQASLNPDRFTVKAFEQERIPPRPYRVGPDAKTSRHNDAFYQLGIDPLDECTNVTLLSHFVSDMGKIRSRASTGLTWRSQRRLTKAIKRAKMMGVIPWLSKASSKVY